MGFLNTHSQNHPRPQPPLVPLRRWIERCPHTSPCTSNAHFFSCLLVYHPSRVFTNVRIAVHRRQDPNNGMCLEHFSCCRRDKITAGAHNSSCNPSPAAFRVECRQHAWKVMREVARPRKKTLPYKQAAGFPRLSLKAWR